MALRLRHGMIGMTSAFALVSMSACSSLGWDDWGPRWDFGSWSGGYADESGPVTASPGVGTCVTTAAVAFRNGPSSKIRLLAVLPPGTVVTTDGRELDGWWGVDYQNASGWIYGSYLKPQ